MADIIRDVDLPRYQDYPLHTVNYDRYDSEHEDAVDSIKKPTGYSIVNSLVAIALTVLLTLASLTIGKELGTYLEQQKATDAGVGGLVRDANGHKVFRYGLFPRN